LSLLLSIYLFLIYLSIYLSIYLTLSIYPSPPLSIARSISDSYLSFSFQCSPLSHSLPPSPPSSSPSPSPSNSLPSSIFLRCDILCPNGAGRCSDRALLPHVLIHQPVQSVVCNPSLPPGPPARPPAGRRDPQASACSVCARMRTHAHPIITRTPTQAYT
jgi:hypothetical protein